MKQIKVASIIEDHSPEKKISKNSCFKIDLMLVDGSIMRVGDQEFITLFPNNTWKIILLTAIYYNLPGFESLWGRLKHLARRKIPDILQ